MQPRFPFGNAAPTLWMVCYKSPNDPQPSCRIPLSNARVMVEGPQDSCNGIFVRPQPTAAVRTFRPLNSKAVVLVGLNYVSLARLASTLDGGEGHWALLYLAETTLSERSGKAGRWCSDCDPPREANGVSLREV